MRVESGQLAVALAAVPALVLVWAGVEKLRRPFPASLAIVRFGLAKRVRPVVGRAAGATEVAAGALLLARPQSPWAYVPAAALLLVFAFLLARAVRRGERFACACFGAGENDSITAATVLRTAVLLALCLGGLAWVELASLRPPYDVGYLQAVATTCVLLASLHLAATINSTHPFRE
jgi:Methylamine utilisation protein MauE